MTTSIREPDKLRMLESLFPSHRSSFDDLPWTESSRTADRHVSHTGLQRLGTDSQRSSTSGIVIDTEGPDDLSRHWGARKQRKRVLPDKLPPAGEAYDYDHSGLPVERLAEFPRRGKIRRRQYASSRRRHHQRGRTRKHRHSNIERGRRREAWSKYRPSSTYRSASLPIDVAIRLLGSRQRRHERGRRHHRSMRRRAQTWRTARVVSDNSRRQSASKRRHKFHRVVSRSPYVSAVGGHHEQSSSLIRRSLTTPSNYVSATSPSLDYDNVQSASTDLPLIYRMRRSLSVGRLRMTREVDKQRQRLILEKLLESSMSEAERTARNLTSSRLDQLLGKAGKSNRRYHKYSSNNFWI